MQEVQLADEEQRVLTAVAAVEADGDPGTLQQVADRSGLDVARTRECLSALTQTHDLVREVGTVPDQGVRYRVKGQPHPR